MSQKQRDLLLDFVALAKAVENGDKTAMEAVAPKSLPECKEMLCTAIAAFNSTLSGSDPEGPEASRARLRALAEDLGNHQQ